MVYKLFNRKHVVEFEESFYQLILGLLNRVLAHAVSLLRVNQFNELLFKGLVCSFARRVKLLELAHFGDLDHVLLRDPRLADDLGSDVGNELLLVRTNVVESLQNLVEVLPVLPKLVLLLHSVLLHLGLKKTPIVPGGRLFFLGARAGRFAGVFAETLFVEHLVGKGALEVVVVYFVFSQACLGRLLEQQRPLRYLEVLSFSEVAF